MNEEDPMQQPPKERIPAIVWYAAVGVVTFGAGMLLESYLAGRTEAGMKLAHERQLMEVTQKAEHSAQQAQLEKQVLTNELIKERESHENDLQAKDRNLSAVSSRAAGMRRALETELSAARSSGEACTARVARISEAIGGVFDSIGEVTGLAQDLGRENEQLKADNHSLSEKLVGWQKWNTERMQRVTVVGQKNG